MKAIWNDEIIAESDDTVVLEGNHYFPMEALNRQFFRQSSQTSLCPWKGEAEYLDIVVDSKTNAGAAWIYPNPKPAAQEISNRVAFWKGVVVK